MARNRGWFGQRSDPQIGERPRHEARADDSKWNVEDLRVAKDIETQLAKPKDETDWTWAEQNHAERAALHQNQSGDDNCEPPREDTAAVDESDDVDSGDADDVDNDVDD